jgi:hypothetical protein
MVHNFCALRGAFKAKPSKVFANEIAFFDSFPQTLHKADYDAR